MIRFDALLLTGRSKWYYNGLIPHFLYINKEIESYEFLNYGQTHFLKYEQFDADLSNYNQVLVNTTLALFLPLHRGSQSYNFSHFLNNNN